MKYTIAMLIVMVPTILVGLGVFHGLIMPYLTPLGFLPMLLTTAAFGLGMGIVAENAIETVYTYLERKFP